MAILKREKDERVDPHVSEQTDEYFTVKKWLSKIVKVKDIILPYISFTSPEFNMLLDRFKSIEVKGEKLKGSFKYSVNYKNVKTHFGLGGVHGAASKGV